MAVFRSIRTVNIRRAILTTAGAQNGPVRQQHCRGVIATINRLRTQLRPILCSRIPELGDMNGLAGVQVIKAVVRTAASTCSPTTSTEPSGNTVALCWRRANFIG